MSHIGIQIKDENNNNIYPNPFPIGAIYMSVDSRNPSAIFGGTWEQIKDRFLLSAGNTYKSGNTGGSTTHRHTDGDLRAMIGSANGQSNTLNFVATGCDNPNNGSRRNGTYTIRGEQSASNESFSHYTPVVGYTNTENHMPPYFVVYVWRRVS